MVYFHSMRNPSHIIEKQTSVFGPVCNLCESVAQEYLSKPEQHILSDHIHGIIHTTMGGTMNLNVQPNNIKNNWQDSFCDGSIRTNKLLARFSVSACRVFFQVCKFPSMFCRFRGIFQVYFFPQVLASLLAFLPSSTPQHASWLLVLAELW